MNNNLNRMKLDNTKDINFRIAKHTDNLRYYDYTIWLKAGHLYPPSFPEFLDILLLMLLHNRGDLVQLYLKEFFEDYPPLETRYKFVFDTYINILQKSKYKKRSYLAIYQSLIFIDYEISHYDYGRSFSDKETFKFGRMFYFENIPEIFYRTFFTQHKVLSALSFKMLHTPIWMNIISLNDVDILTEIIKEMFFKMPFDKYKNLSEWEKDQNFNKFKVINTTTNQEIPIQWKRAYLRTHTFYVKEKNRLNELSNFVNNNKFDESFKAKFYILTNMFENTNPFDTRAFDRKSFFTEKLNIKLETIGLNFEQISLNTEECWSLLAMEAAIMLYFMINTNYLVLTNEFITKLENKGIYLKDLDGNFKFLYTKPLYPIPLSDLSEEFWDLELNKRSKIISDMNKIIIKRLQDKKNDK